ncbi:CTL-like protein 2 isoform X2 [Anoplophora glabripennis]|uniref:CTL-like protein 2 isoform X2 n=1 Tax=Anoplophora glabripennis TaxID=217634 RepID=UPI00087492DF|nr:CTL-like protein 2 isoform X2 [Anoplophora glabripennis]
MRSTSNEDLGEPLQYDPQFDGPLKRRSCTDVICLLIFAVFMTGWVGIGIYAFMNGDPSTLLVPKDTAGSRCGVDSHVKDRPYLFFFDLTRCLDPRVPFTGCNTTQVCVTQCPSTNYFKTGATYEGDTGFCNTYTNSSTSDCPDWYLISTVFLNRCLYNVGDRKKLKRPGMAEVMGDEISVMKSLLNPYHMWISLAVQNALTYLTENENVHKIGQNVVEDIIRSWWKILLGVVLALLACIIYIIMLRWMAAPIVWLSIIGVLACLSCGLYFTTIKYIEFRDKYNAEVYEEVKSSYKTKRDLFLTGLIIISIVLAIILLMLIFLRKRIILAIALVKEGSKAVSSVTASLFFPILPWVLQLGIIAYAIAVALYLKTTGDPVYRTRHIESTCNIGFEDNVECDPDEFRAAIENNTLGGCANAICKFIRIDNSDFYPYLQAINVFGFFWLVFFISALGQMVLAAVFAQWYWTFHKSALPFFAVTVAFCRTVRYHLGTLAFGSLIIAICRIIRVLLEYIDYKLKKYDNDLVKAILCCCKCFFWCLENFLKFINKNAYIMCAVHGKNFCASAKDAFLLLMRNIVRVFVLDKVTDFLFFLSKLLVTCGVGAVSYVIFATDLTSIDNSSLNYGIVPVIIIMVCTYLISSVFFSVYSMAVDTLFLCFLEDCERNDGSAEKPYFMSKNLMKIFGKKNNLS